MGSPFYIAPEILIEGTQYDEKVDIWALGIMTYEIISGNPPFDSDVGDIQELYMNICKQPADFDKSEFESVSKDAIDFIKKCLSKKADKRPSA